MIKRPYPFPLVCLRRLGIRAIHNLDPSGRRADNESMEDSPASDLRLDWLNLAAAPAFAAVAGGFGMALQPGCSDCGRFMD